MLVVHVAASDVSGGAARSAYRLHEGLRMAGVDSRMLVLNKSSADDNVEQAVDREPAVYHESDIFLRGVVERERIARKRTDLSNTLFTLGAPGMSLAAHPLIREADIIQLHWVNGLITPVGIRELIDLGKPVVWTLHDQWAYTGGCHYSAGCENYRSGCETCPQLSEDPFRIPARLQADKAALFAAQNLTVVGPSRWMAETARASRVFSSAQIECIPYGLDLNLFRPHDQNDARKALRLDEAPFMPLFVCHAADEQRKGFDLFAEALNLAMKESDFSQAVEAGRVQALYCGMSLPAIKELPVPVREFGMVDDDALMAKIYSAADTFVLPSREDNLPNTVLEALACGTPVVALRIGGVPDMVQDGVTGFLAPSADAEGLAQALLQQFRDPSEQRRIEARSVAESRYFLKRQAVDYIVVYEQALSRVATAAGSALPRVKTKVIGRTSLMDRLATQVGPALKEVLPDIFAQSVDEAVPSLVLENRDLLAERRDKIRLRGERDLAKADVADYKARLRDTQQQVKDLKKQLEGVEKHWLFKAGKTVGLSPKK